MKQTVTSVFLCVFFYKNRKIVKKKKDAAPKKDSGGDDQLVFYFWPYLNNPLQHGLKTLKHGLKVCLDD